MPVPSDAHAELEKLRQLLSVLPPKSHPAGSIYPFEGFLPDEEWTERTGTVQGSVNHSLEVAFGSRAKAGNSPIEFKSHRRDLVAVVDVLAMHITGHDGENPILIKWISDLQRAAEHAGSAYIDPGAPGPSKRQSKKTEKRIREDIRVAK
ncbi:hypothetical protein FRC12_019097 [Ceratobasidium sp. 428]|nr:hypothetical protein FRC12_019097 [Ceratobasidium sp. 428]